MTISLIACVDINNGIGTADGRLLFNLPKDMAHFKSITSGKIVVMGRKTWDSLPKKPLEKRKNYILTHDKSFSPIGAKVVYSVDDVLKLSKNHDVFICGGGELYEQFIDYADKLIITHVHVIHDNAKVFFPEFSHRDWRLVKSQKHEADDKHLSSFTFATYERIKK